MRSQEDVAAMQCPACRVPLAMSDRQGIEIDYCPQCRGVWLDRGELDKIVERSVPELAPAPTPAPQAQPWGDRHRGEQRGDYRGDHDRQPHYGHGQHGYGKPHKRKSFLQELFD
jgi:Zn-finger nucleic acid-binding protein